MNPVLNRREAAQTAAARQYMMVCLAALVVVLLVQVMQGEWDCWTLLPVVIGGLGIVLRLSFAPLMLVAVVALNYLTVPLRGYYAPALYEYGPSFSIFDLVQGAAVLAYVVGHYRLQGLTRNLFPDDPRRPGGSLPRAAHRRQPRFERDVAQIRRSPHLVTAEELTRLLMAVVVFAGLAQLVWYLLPSDWTIVGLDFAPRLGRPLALVWLLGLGMLIVAAVLSYLGQQHATPAEAALYLQDVLWHETRREQRRPNRWLAWARWRRKETS